MEEFERVSDRAVEILGRCVSPNDKDALHRAGLVVGNVQSGKTASFTAVTALARDNDFAMVICLLGTTTALLRQGSSRLAKDLGFDEGHGGDKSWAAFSTAEFGSATLSAIRKALESRNDANQFTGHPTVVLSVMKERTHLEKCARLIDSVGSLLDHESVLVIDDEADQAGMDISKPADDPSTIYAGIRGVRRGLRRHTLLQYTATPQANLLASIADEVSPEFVEVLEPGTGYVGGRTFFIERPELVEIIPDGEVDAAVDDSQHQPPDSLRAATAVFILGAAYSLFCRKIRDISFSNRSMLIHPTHLVAPHAKIASWERHLLSDWRDLLTADQDVAEDPDFNHAHDELQKTVADLPDLVDLAEAVRATLQMTQVREINGRADDPPPKWHQADSWILVGGQLLDRGYTVEGLTVTYMPRGIGVGNADTLQQRGRFYGYKESYLDICRLWFADETRTALTSYVRHEEALRESLRKAQDQHESLRDWKRRFVLSRDLQLTRPTANRLAFVSSVLGGWQQQRDLLTIGSDPEALKDRRRVAAVLQELGAPTDLAAADGHGHVIREAPVESVLTCLAEMPEAGGDNQMLLRASMVLRLMEPADRVTIVSMKSGAERKRRRADSGGVAELFEGRRTGYLGDRAVKHADQPTIQIHNVSLTDAQGEVLVSQVPALAIYLPSQLDQVLEQVT